MASKVKVKKSLKFLKKSERKILSVSVKNEKPSFVQNLRICLENDYKDYLKPLPLRQSVFSFANNCTVFNEVSENLFNTLIDIFDSVKKGGSKYSKFQLKWYTFSGKCLDKRDSAFDATLTHFEQTVIESVPGSSVKRRRLSLVNALRLNTVYDPVMSKPVLVKLSICTSSVGLLYLLITGVSIIVVPFLQKMHL